MRKRWFGSSVFVATALCVSLGAAMAATSSASSPASATAPAERSARQSVANPVDCRVLPGQFALSPGVETDATMVLHQFDGHVLDDRRVSIPVSFRVQDNFVRRYGVTLSADCRTVIAAHDTGTDALRIDVSTGAVRSFRFAVSVRPVTPSSPSVFVLPDNQIVTVQQTADGFQLVNAEDGSVAASWTTTIPAASAFVDRSGRALHFVRPSSAGVSVDSLPLARADAVASTTFPGNYSAVTDIQFAASGRRMLLSHFTAAGQARVTVFDLDGGVLGSLAADWARFAADDQLILCRSDGAYRSDLSGNATLIEPFDDVQQMPQPGGPPIPFSAKQLACGSAVQSG